MLEAFVLTSNMPSTLSKLNEAAGRGPDATDIDRGCGDTNQTPLIVASVTGSVRVARELLRLGASVSVADNDGYTALHHSIYHKHLDVSKELISGKRISKRGLSTTNPILSWAHRYTWPRRKGPRRNGVAD